MLTYFMLVLAIVLMILAICLAVFYRKQYELVITRAENTIDEVVESARTEIARVNKAWEEGLDDREEAWGAEVHDLNDKLWIANNEVHNAEADLQLLGEVAEGYYEELVGLRRQFDSVCVEKNHLKADNRAHLVEIERLNNINRTVEAERDALTVAFEWLSKDYDDIEELYGISATELLDTVNEVDKIASEVHDFMSGAGTPFD